MLTGLPLSLPSLTAFSTSSRMCAHWPCTSSGGATRIWTRATLTLGPAVASGIAVVCVMVNNAMETSSMLLW